MRTPEYKREMRKPRHQLQKALAANVNSKQGLHLTVAQVKAIAKMRFEQVKATWKS